MPGSQRLQRMPDDGLRIEWVNRVCVRRGSLGLMEAKISGVEGRLGVQRMEREENKGGARTACLTQAGDISCQIVGLFVIESTGML